MLNLNDPIILTCARACDLAYNDFADVAFSRGVKALGFEDIRCIDRAGVQAFCAANADTVLICFRGSDDMADWLANASAKKIRSTYHVGLVHTGFLRTSAVVENDVFGYLSNHLGKKLVVTGHSLGAAMAVLFAAHGFSSPDAIITFGAPRVGNKEFALNFNNRYGDRSLRFVNNNDAVTRMPWKVQGYEHVWRQQYFDAKGNLHLDYRPGFWRKLGHAVQGRVSNLLKLRLGDGITDHGHRDYRLLVEAYFEKTKKQEEK